MQAHAIQGPWPAGERILVCISEDPRCAGLVRYELPHSVLVAEDYTELALRALHTVYGLDAP